MVSLSVWGFSLFGRVLYTHRSLSVDGFLYYAPSFTGSAPVEVFTT